MELAINQIQPGMVASNNVRDRMGRVLVPAGTALDARKIKMLKAWGIHQIEVDGETEEETATLNLDLWKTQALTMIDPADREHVLIIQLLPKFVRELAKTAG